MKSSSSPALAAVVIVRSGSTMWKSTHLLLWIGFTAGFISGFHSSRVSKDYCNMELFNATCRQDEAIIIENARYGRMSIGRCMREYYGFQGCAADVQRFLDSKCSGRQVCRFQVPDPVLYEMKPCPVDFTSYLEATFSCVPVAVGEKVTCDPGKPLRIFNTTGFLSTELAEERGYGSPHCPWMIEAMPGQRINLTLYNFGTLTKGGSPSTADVQGGAAFYGPSRPDVCFEVAVVTDGRDGKKSITVCGGDQRETAAFWSRSHIVRVEIPNPKLLKTIGAFIIRYKVTGCHDLKLSGDAWHQKNGDVLVVRCNATSQVWHLICKGTRWVGDIGNCSFTNSADVNSWSLEQMFSADDAFPFGVLIAVSLGVAMGVIIGGTLLCAITMYMKRQRRNLQGYSQPKEQHVCTTFPSPAPPQHSTVSSWLIDSESVILQDPDVQRTSYRIAIPRGGVGGVGGGIGGGTQSSDNVDYNSFDNTSSSRPCVISQYSSSSNSFKPKPHFYESPCQ